MMKIVMRWIPGLMGSISRIRRVGRISLISLFFAFPFFASAQVSSPQNISYFQYELAPGQVTDDALAVIHESSVPETIVVYAVDAIGGSGDSFSYSTAAERTELASWIRFLDPEIPEGSEEVRVALTGITSPRYFELCGVLQYGEVEKREREQKAVRALNRNLSPSEIQYLELLTKWCWGGEEAEVALDPGETVRVPFVIIIPNAVAVKEYHAALFIEFSDGTRNLAANVQETVPGAREGRLSLVSSRVNERESGTFHIELVFVNTGDRTVRGEVNVVVESSFPKESRTLLVHKAALAPGGTGTAEFVSDKPFFGSLTIRAYAGSEDQGKIIFSSFVVPWTPVIVLAVLISILLYVKIQKIYWKRVWRNALRESWSPVVCEERISISRLAVLYQVPESLIALLNNVSKGYEFQHGDRVLLPSSHLIVFSKKGVRTRKKNL